jgi:hypothetical protein
MRPEAEDHARKILGELLIYNELTEIFDSFGGIRPIRILN